MSLILIAEDDLRLGENIKLNLELRGHQVDHTSSVSEAKALMSQNRYEALLLDIELPDGDGLDLCRIFRTKDAEIPILVISARHEESLVVRGLDWGADDYIRKPFGMKELAARLDRLIGKHRRGSQSIAIGELVLDLDHKTARFAQNELNLSRREFDLLRVFVNYPKRVYSRTQLVEALAYSEDIQERTIDSHLSHLRGKLRQAGCRHIKIGSVYGSGYRLELTEPDHAG